MRKQAVISQAMAKDMGSLVALGKKRGVRNPFYWAKKIIESRQKKEAERAARREQREQPKTNDHDNRWLDF